MINKFDLMHQNLKKTNPFFLSLAMTDAEGIFFWQVILFYNEYLKNKLLIELFLF